MYINVLQKGHLSSQRAKKQVLSTATFNWYFSHGILVHHYFWKNETAEDQQPKLRHQLKLAKSIRKPGLMCKQQEMFHRGANLSCFC